MRKRAAALAVAVVLSGCCCVAPVVFIGGFAMLENEDGERQPSTALAGCEVQPGEEASAAAAALDDEQWHYAAVIVSVGAHRQVPPRGWVIAVATAMQESSLRNLPHLGDDNDHDSLGLFQQRPSQGWGTESQLRDPEYAAAAFYQRLVEVDGWQQLPLTVAAQAVQRSAHPEAYARHEPAAVAVVDAVAGGVVAAAGADHELRCAQPHEVTAAGWTRPVPGPVWSGFRTAGRPAHYGVDIGVERGTVIRAAADGRVILVDCHATLHGQPYSCDVDGSPQVQGCGWYVDILHAGNAVTRYCHLLERPLVGTGELVGAGQPIGLVGSSGRSSGPHLHFEVELRRSTPTGSRMRVERRQTDPVAYLAERGVGLECTNTPVDCEPVHGDRVRVQFR